jgi:hypothetical protein
MEKYIFNSNLTVNSNKWLPEDYYTFILDNVVKWNDIIFKWNIIWWVKDWHYTFINCLFDWDINIEYGSTTFKNCTFKITNKSKFSQGSIFFENCTFEDNIEESRNVNFGSIIFFNCILKDLTLKFIWTNGIFLHDTIFDNLKIEHIRIIKEDKDFQTWELIPFHIDINSSKKSWNITIDWISNLENLHIGDTRNKWQFWNIEIIILIY